MADVLTPDLCVIGGGAGGLAAAATARRHGASVVIVERAELGGERLYAACIPSKALVSAGRQAQAIRDAQLFGVTAEDPKVNFARLHDHVHQVVADIVPGVSAAHYEALGAIVIAAEARFLDNRTVVAGEQLIRARRFVIATGSRAAVPDLPGIETVRFLTNETVFDETRKPSHLVIVGAGPTGLEIGQAYHRLGATVTIIDPGYPFEHEDLELAELVLRRLLAEGVNIRAGLAVSGIAPRGHGVDVLISDGTSEELVSGSHLLVATGRAPNIEQLALAQAGIRHSAAGIAVNRGLRTSNRRVYAIGDVVEGPRYSHAAVYQGQMAARSALFGLPGRDRPEIYPAVIHTDPELASVGLTEAEARRRRIGYRVFRLPFAQNDRARTGRDTEGLVKVLLDRGGKVLGAHIAGPDAGELITFYAFAVARGIKASELAGFVAPYPSLAGIVQQLAAEFENGEAGRPWLQRLAAINRYLP